MQPSVIGCVLLSMTVVLVTGRYSPRGNQQKQWKPIQTIYGRRPQQQSSPPPRNLENFAWTPASYVSPMKASPSRIFPRRNFIDDRFVMKFNNRKNLLLDESEENSIDDCGELNPMNNYQQEKPQQRPRRHYQQQQQYHHQPQQQPQQQYPEQKYNSYEGSNDRPASMSPRDYNYELPPDRIELIPVDLDSYSYQPKEPQVIEINGAGYAPIVLQFRSMSTPLLIKQVHQESERQHIEPTSREEPPTILKHRVIKPIIQNLHEIIVPKRRIIQEILPVEEEVKTIVAKAKEPEKYAQPSSSRYRQQKARYAQPGDSTAASDTLPIISKNDTEYSVHVEHTLESS